MNVIHIHPISRQKPSKELRVTNCRMFDLDHERAKARDEGEIARTMVRNKWQIEKPPRNQEQNPEGRKRVPHTTLHGVVRELQNPYNTRRIFFDFGP